MLPLVEGRAAGWPWWTLASLAAVPVLLSPCWASRQRAVARAGGQPLLDPAVLRRPVARPAW